MTRNEIADALSRAIKEKYNELTAHISHSVASDELFAEITEIARLVFDEILRKSPSENGRALANEIIQELLPSRSLMQRPSLVRSYLRSPPRSVTFDLEGRPRLEARVGGDDGPVSDEVIWWHAKHGVLESVLPGHFWRLKDVRHAFRRSISEGLRENVLRAEAGQPLRPAVSESGPKRARGRKDRNRNPHILELERMVREMHAVGMSQQKMCQRLDAQQVRLPPHVSWREEKNWVDAFRRCHSAVTKWLSNAARPRDLR